MSVLDNHGEAVTELNKAWADKAVLVELVLDPNLTPAAKNLIAIAIRDDEMPPTDETRSWYKVHCY